jgi:hypothetical protein
MGKSINPMFILKIQGGAAFGSALNLHRLDEFATGYSLAGCTPAEPASASPAGFHLRTSIIICQAFLKAGEYLLDLKGRPRQNINIRWGQFR